MIIASKIIMLVVFLLTLLACRRSLQKSAKKAMYSYRITSTLGVIIFLGFCIILQSLRLYSALHFPEYKDEDFLMHVFFDLTTAFTGSIFLAAIPAFVFSVFLLIANIVLFIKQSKSPRNALGIALGVCLMLGTYVVFSAYGILDQIMNVHSYGGYHFSLFVENVFATVVIYCECMMAATIYVTIKSARHQASPNKEYVIVLGCRVREDGMPSGVLKRRVEAAMKFARSQQRKTGKMPTLVFSGGKGDDEPISEAESMQKYVATQDYGGKMLLEEKSTTTHENFKYSKKLVDVRKNVAFATTDFHVFRSGVYATQLGFKHIEGIGAKSPWYFYYNAIIREFVANFNSERKMHIFNIGLLAAAMGVIILVSYCFGIM